jgi:hypothetical protein
MAQTVDPDGEALAGRERRRARRGARRQTGGPDIRSFLACMAVAALLSALTVATFALVPRYQDQGEPVADNLDFRSGFAGWQTSGIITLDETELGHATLQNRDPGQIVHLYRQINLPRGRTHLLVSADVATSQVQAGEEDWHRARIFFGQQAPDGSFLWHRPHDVALLVGTSGRHNVREVFEIGPTIGHGLLGIELAHATGMFEIANLRVERLEELTGFRLAATLVVAVWCLLVAWVGFRIIDSIDSTRLRILLGVTAAVALVGVFMPTTIRQTMVNAFASGFGLQGMEPDSIGHMAIFALLACVVRWGRRQDPLLCHGTGWLMVAVSTEVLQLFTADRDASLGDWLADAIGASLGLAIAEVGLRVERAIEEPRKPRADVEPDLP